MFQLALGAAIAVTVVSATTAFVRVTDEPESVSILGLEVSGDDDLDNDEELNRDSIVRTIHFAVAAVILLGGLTTLGKWHTLPVAFGFGGLVLLFAGGVLNSPQLYLLAVTDAQYPASTELDVLNFLIVAAGTGALLWWGLTFERAAVVEGEDVDLGEDDDVAGE
jgi:hypothetical protein